MHEPIHKRSILCAAAVTVLLSLSAGCSSDSPVEVHTNPPAPGTRCFDFRDYLHTAGFISTSGQANATVVTGDHLFVADGDKGLQVFDVRDPAAPVFLGSADTTGIACGIDRGDDIVCAAFGEAGLIIFDVASGSNPRIIGGAATPGAARAVEINDTVAYVADDVVGLMAFDIKNPAAPAALGVENTPGKAVGVDVTGPLAYVADELLGLRVVNVSNPVDPWLVNVVPTGGSARGVCVAEGYAYVAVQGGGIVVVDVSTVDLETVVDTLDTPGNAYDAAVLGGILYIADGSSGLRIADTKAPDGLAVINTAPSTAVSLSVSLGGGYAYVAEGTGGVRIVDISNPLPPGQLGRLTRPGPDPVTEVEAAGSYVYGLAGGGGLFVAELRDDGGLELRGSTPVALGQPTGLLVEAGYAYVPVRPEGLFIYDVTAPASPVQHDYLQFVVEVRGLDVVDGMIYFATGGNLFGVYELGSQVSPAFATAVGARTTAVAVDSVFAFVTSATNELLVVNVEDAAFPFVFSRTLIEGNGTDIIIRDGYAYITVAVGALGGRYGVGIYELQYGFLPRAFNFIDTAAEPTKMALSGNTVYVAQGQDGLEVFDISNPLAPRRIGSLGTEYTIPDVAAAQGVLLVSEGEAGVFVLSAQECISP